MNRRATSILLGVNGVLAAGLALLWLGPGSSTAWERPAAQAPNLDDALAAILRPRPEVAAEFPRIVERPLFAATRRPPEPPSADPKNAEEPPPPPPVELDKLRMFGTINGPTMQGILAEVEGESRFIRTGEKVGDWTLRQISSSEATFAKGDEQRVVPLPLAQVPTSPATAAAAPPTPARARDARPPRTRPSAREARAPQRAAPARPAVMPPSPPPADPDQESEPKPAVQGSWGP